MIKRTFVVFLSTLLLVLGLVGCSSENAGQKLALSSTVTAATDAQEGTEDSEQQVDTLTSAQAAATTESSETTAQNTAAVDGMSGAAALNPEAQARPQKLKEYGSLWQSDLFADSRFQLNIKLTPSEKKEAKILARSFESHMERAKPFMHYLLTELKARNLPVELAAIPLVESGFDLRARSHAGAHGPWQFTRQTGKSFGLEVSANYDEFYDFVASTQASLDYLTHLHKELKRWDFALIAYNQGEFGVKRVIRRAKAAGITDLNVDKLSFSRMGRLYLKRVRAYADIMHHPEKYGVEYPEVEDREVFKQVQVAGRVNSMKKVAELSGADLKLLKTLNAGYLSDRLVSKKQRSILVPVENVAALEKALGIRPEVPFSGEGVAALATR